MNTQVIINNDPTLTELPLSWDSLTDSGPKEDVKTDSISDALIISLSSLGRVDIEYMSSITGEDYRTIIEALEGSIYQNPDTWGKCYYRGWETAEEYLSGNLVRKWRSAHDANETYHGYFEKNLRAIEAVAPKSVGAKDIYVTLGSPWIPAYIIDDFITHILKLRGREFSGTAHDEVTGTWDIPNKSYYTYVSNVASLTTYGTPRLDALHILERTLNMKSVAITDEVKSKASRNGKKRVINHSETLLALEKQQLMIEEFKRWVWKDKDRKETLETIFENNFGCVKRRIFDGSFLRFPGLSPDIQLFPYQKNAVARILFSQNTLLAHDVGSGKTYVMIAAGMELKRMGLSEKNLYVVPNSIVGQWKGIFGAMYPSAKILCVEPKHFTPAKKESILKKIRDEKYDAIIMAYSCFERIPLSIEYYIRQLEEERESLKASIQKAGRKITSLDKKREAVEKELGKLAVAIDETKNLICFDDLGVTRLFVDEAHNYKNVPIDTKTDKVLGISKGGSKKCKDMMDKVHLIQRENRGGGVVMATGTPITNSVTDAYIMQKYLQSGELGLLDLSSFDAWIGMFAEKSTEFEIDVDTSSYRLATRFSKFHNLPELTALLSSIADFHQVDKTAGVPDFDDYTDALISKTDEFSDYLGEISKRAEIVRGGLIDRKEDNMLLITTDGRKAALDLRLVNPNAKFTYQSKVARCAENVYSIYKRTEDKKSVQLIFCDSSTPKAGFNIYDEIKRLLVSMGMPEEDIAYIHDAESETQRAKLFAKVRRGDVRVLIGSTFKLGLGVNVQDKLIAIHHADIPWKPSDQTQREGRILRQGNENEKVHIFRYITEGSFDAYSWQLLETKQRFIADLLSGSLTDRSGSDIENTVLNYAEIKALAVGNPLVKERVETANKLSRYLTLQRKSIEARERLEKELSELPERIAKGEEHIKSCLADLHHYKESVREYDKEERREIRCRIAEALENHVLIPEEKTVVTYQGFRIVLPSNMIKEKPYVWLQATGKYYVEMGDTDVGILIRIDNFLEKFSDYLRRMQDALTVLTTRREEIVKELAKTEDFASKIESTKAHLAKLDKKLGV